MKCESGSSKGSLRTESQGLEFRARVKKMTLHMSGVFVIGPDGTARAQKAYVMQPCIINAGHLK